MIKSYLSLSGECVTRKTIEKSEFITTSRHVWGEDQAREFVSEVKENYPDATHNCYAFVADNLGNFLRFSDDGEPQGTAGMPILEVLKTNCLYETAIVVTRYFGGIKLGAGGLVRAYSGSAAENIAVAKKVMYQNCAENRYTVGYSEAAAVARFFAERGVNVLNKEYTDGVSYTVAVKKSDEEEINASLSDILSGRVQINKLREYFFPFPV